MGNKETSTCSKVEKPESPLIQGMPAGEDLTVERKTSTEIVKKTELIVTTPPPEVVQ